MAQGTAHCRRPGTNSAEEGRRDEKKKKTTDTSGIKKNPRGGIGRGAKEMDDLSVCATHTHTLDDDEPKRESAVDDESVRTKKKKPTGQMTKTKSKRTNACL